MSPYLTVAGVSVGRSGHHQRPPPDPGARWSHRCAP